MKYISTDRLCDFEFHESEWRFVSWENGNLTVSIDKLNIRKDAEQNDTGKDMEIKEAFATFIVIKQPTYELPRIWYKDENGNSYTDEPRVVLEGREALDKFIVDLKSECRARCSFFDHNGEVYKFSGMGYDWISFAFGFESVRIEWDDYKRVAWYEGHSYHKRNLVLGTPDGDVTVQAFITESTVPLCDNGVQIAPPGIGVGLNYEKKNYYCGVYPTLEEALVGLQAALPEGVTVKNLE